MNPGPVISVRSSTSTRKVLLRARDALVGILGAQSSAAVRAQPPDESYPRISGSANPSPRALQQVFHWARDQVAAIRALGS